MNAFTENQNFFGHEIVAGVQMWCFPDKGEGAYDAEEVENFLYHMSSNGYLNEYNLKALAEHIKDLNLLKLLFKGEKQNHVMEMAVMKLCDDVLAESQQFRYMTETDVNTFKKSEINTFKEEILKMFSGLKDDCYSFFQTL